MALLCKKKQLQFLTIAFFIFLVLNGTAAAISSTHTPTTLYVDAGGSGNYTTIQAAVGNATSGDTIIVYPGTYTEVVDVNVANLTIRSLSGNPEDTIVRTLSPSHNFKVIANNVTISGFNITGEGYYTGVFITGVSGINIINNKFSGNDCAIQMESSSGCNLINNTVSGSTSYGFHLSYSISCTLANNTISDTDNEGIYLYNSGSCTLANNTVSNTSYDGIYLSNSSGCALTNNIVSNSYEDGICLSNSSNCNLTGNAVSNTSNYNIYLSYSSNCNLTGNVISNTYDNAIYLYESDDCILAGNVVSNTSYDGIRLSSSNNCTFANNTVSNTGYYGISLYSSNYCTFVNNTISNNGYDGFYLYYSSSCNLTGNTVSDTDHGGFHLYNSSSCNLTENTVLDTSYGIYTYESGNCILTNNTVSDYEYEGIYLDYSEECVLRNNTASSGRYGISLWDAKNCTLTGNIMSGNLYNFDLDIYDLDSATGNIIDTSNLVDGKAVYYLVGEPNPSIGSDAGVIYCINCGDVEIKDFVLQNNSYAVFLYNTSLEMQNNTINNTIYGVGVLSSQDVRLSDNRIENSLAGIVFEEAMNITLTDNTVRNFVYGVVTFDSENCTVTGNSIQNSMEDYGLLTSGNSRLVRGEENTLTRENSLINSKLVQSRRAEGFGIYSIYSRDLRLENNIVDQVSFVGIYLEDSQNARLVRNSVRNIGSVGIYSDGSTSVELLDNTVQNVTGEAQLYKAVNSPLVSKSSEPSGYGIYFDYSQDLRLEGNTVEDCYPVWGIYLYEPVNATLESNTLKNCLGGLIAVLSENFSVNDCSVTNCTSGGILVINPEEEAETGYTVSGCTVEGNAIGLLAIGEGTLAGNTLSGNSYGLVLYGMNNSLIYGNSLVLNSLAGLVLDPEETELMSRIGLVRSMESPESENNTIYNNYFNNVNNTLIYSEANNTWNISKASGESIVGGPYLGGNYWANPSGTGFSENCTDADKDGIADSSYEFVNGTFDYLPLTEIPSTTTRHSSSANYIPSSGGSTGVTDIDSAQKRVVAGSKATFSFNNPVSGILGLSFTSQQYSGNVIARIEALGDGSSGETPEGEVYQLMNILVGNERFESETNINGASINFRVSKSWVEKNNIDVSTITINRFHDEEWNALVTERTGEDEEYYYFRAETPGFSRYAITGDRLGAVVITPAEVEETGTVTGEEQTEDVKKSTPGFESAFAVLGVLASVFFAKKRILK